MKKIISVMLVVAVFLLILSSFVGCKEKTEQDLIVGKWSTMFDFSNNVNNDIKNANKQFSDYIKVSDFAVKVEYDFKKNGEYSISFDEDSFKRQAKKLEDKFPSVVEEYLSDFVLKHNLGESAEEFCKNNGSSFEMEAKALKEQVNLSKYLTAFNEKGKYKIKDGKIYLFDNGKNKNNEKTYFRVKISDKELELKEYFSDFVFDKNNVDINLLMPIKLTK